MTVQDSLATLIAFPSVVGTPNNATIDWIGDYARTAGAEVTVLPGPEGDRSNIFVTIGPRGGRGYIPGHCTAEIEARAVPGISPSSLLEPVRARHFALRDGGFDVAWHELSTDPALVPANGSELAAVLTELTGQAPLTAVRFGSEAGLYQQAGIDAVICGPGDISRARRPDEYIEIGELAACRRMIEDLGARLAA